MRATCRSVCFAGQWFEILDSMPTGTTRAESFCLPERVLVLMAEAGMDTGSTYELVPRQVVTCWTVGWSIQTVGLARARHWYLPSGPWLTRSAVGRCRVAAVYWRVAKWDQAMGSAGAPSGFNEGESGYCFGWRCVRAAVGEPGEDEPI